MDALNPSDRTKLDTLFEYLGDQDRITNPEKFKKVKGSDGIFAFKSFQVRLLGFHAPGGEFWLAHAIVKKDNKLKTRDISKAEEIRNWFFENR